MSLRVLIVPDKFKGTLTAAQAAEAIAAGWREVRPDDELELLPMSDGGDGFGEVMSAALNASVETVQTVDAAHRRCRAQWWWVEETETAIIESARIVGLAMLPPGKFHPFHLDTYGLGAVIQAALDKGARHCLVGIGGSATNDAGFGLALSLGWFFSGRDDESIEDWPRLNRLDGMLDPFPNEWFDSITVAVDVQNPLLGARGCTRVYGPQKGLQPEDFPAAERALRQLAKVCKQEFRRDYAKEPGAGAAGGLGFGFRAFLNARLRPGFDLFARHTGLKQRLRRADLVLTGEGAIDQSTLMGKGVGQIAEWCRELKIPCLGLAGTVTTPEATAHGFTQARGLTELTTPEKAKARPAQWLKRLASEVASSRNS